MRASATKGDHRSTGYASEGQDVDWVCPYQIKGLGRSRVEVAHGLDALQALMMALEAIRLRLEQNGLQLHVAGGRGWRRGVSARRVPTFFGPEGAAKTSQLIDREVERFSRTVETKSKRRTRQARA